MSNPLRIYLADLVHDYTPCNYVVPLNIGYMAAYLKDRFGDRIETRMFKSPEILIDALKTEDAPHVIGFSNYSWNQELNRRIIERCASRLPDTVVCMGGPHIRTDDEGIARFLRENRVDYYAMFEAELPFGHLIEYFLANKPTHAVDCDREIPGIAYLAGEDLRYPRFSFEGREIVNGPSPYVSGVMDEFLISDQWIPLLETNRGCPYACTFCVWGISALDKVRVFPMERVIEDIRYVAAHSPSSRWIFADANFGMLKRDLEIAEEIRRCADKHGVLQHAQVWWAKNSSRHTVQIAKTFGSLCDPLAAVQTMDDEVLKIIKRDNIKLSTMTDLLDRFHEDGLKAATDVLVGLPGESFEAHLNSLRKVFALGFDNIDAGNIRLLPGSEMEDDATREKFQFQTKYRLIPGSYGEYDGNRVFEFEESVRSSKDITEDEMVSLRVIHFFVWALSNLGIGRSILRWLETEHDVSPVDAMLSLVRRGKNRILDDFLEEFTREAADEWFDTPEELTAYYTENFEELIRDGFLKMNAKYAAKMLLDPQFTEAILSALCDGFESPLAKELVQFCMDRIYFLSDRVATKDRTYSPELVEFLKEVYPHHSFETNTCRFEIDEKTRSTIEYHLKKNNFDTNPISAITLTTESVRIGHFMCEFTFGSQVKEVVGDLAGSFDYHAQLGGLE